MNTGYRRQTRQNARSGQAITELALIVPIIATILLGIVELAGAYGAKMNLQAAVAQAARIGAIEGNLGHTSISCPYTASSDAVDANMVNAVLGTHGIDSSSVQRIDIYKSDLNGHVSNNLIDTYSTTPFVNASPYSWPSCNRSDEPADSLGVHVTYKYHPIISLFGFNTITMDDYSVQRINPSKAVSPCPYPDPPNDVVANWDTGATSLPSASDVITWTAVPGATSYEVYADVNGAGLGGIPVMTINNPPSSGPVVANYTGDTTYAPSGYAVRGHNFCGDGDLSNEAIDNRPPLPTAPTIITATASITTPGSDYLSWISVPSAVTYTVTVTSSIGTGQSFTVLAPITSTTIADLYTAPVTITYAVSATNALNVPGPVSTAVVTPTAIDDSAMGSGINQFFYSKAGGGTGNWTYCTSSNNTTMGCTTTVGTTSSLYGTTYNSSASWSKTAGNTIDFKFTASPTSHVQVYGAVLPSSGQAYMWIDTTATQPTAISGKPLIDWYSATPSGHTLITTLSPTTNGTQYLHIRVAGVANIHGCSGSTCNYIGIDAVNVQP